MKATATIIFEDDVLMKDGKSVRVTSDPDPTSQEATNADRAKEAFKSNLTTHFINTVDDAYDKFLRKKDAVKKAYEEDLDKKAAEEAKAKKAAEEAKAKAKKAAEEEAKTKKPNTDDNKSKNIKAEVKVKETENESGQNKEALQRV